MLPGCATSYSHTVKTPPVADHRDIFYLEAVPPVAQKAYQCGPASLESVLRYWGKDADAVSISRSLMTPGTRGILNFSLVKYAKDQGFWAELPEADEQKLKEFIKKNIPPIVMLNMGVLWVQKYHFVVLKGFDEKERIFYANTGEAQTQAISYAEFHTRWEGAGRWCLVICPPERVDWELDGARANELGLNFEKSGKLEDAQKWYQAALRQDAQNDLSRFNLANVYLKQQHFQEARVIYSELLKTKPDWADAANNLAWIFFEEGNPREAARVIEAAFKNGAKRNFDILDTLGLSYCRMGDKARAEQIFEEALRAVPAENPQSLELIRNHLKECGFS